MVLPQRSTAGRRRPQCGQSLRSFGASCSSEQPQSRRFSTDQGSSLGGRGERQQLADDLELLAGIAIDVDGPRLDLANHLAVGAGTQAVSLSLTHEGETYQRIRSRIRPFNRPVLSRCGS